MNVPVEIERKWLCDKDKIPYDLSKYCSKKLRQSYISFSPTIRLRSENGEKFILCVKSKAKKGSVARSEFEIEISGEEYENLALKTEGRVIEKTRYFVPCGKYTMEIDLFEGELEGLCYMEIEFESEKEAMEYTAPEWVIKDVSFDKAYTNASLAKSDKTVPFKW